MARSFIVTRDVGGTATSLELTAGTLAEAALAAARFVASPSTLRLWVCEVGASAPSTCFDVARVGDRWSTIKNFHLNARFSR